MDYGFVITTALLGAGAAYGLTAKGRPKSTLTGKKRKVAIVCFLIGVGCLGLALAVVVASHSAPH